LKILYARTAIAISTRLSQISRKSPARHCCPVDPFFFERRAWIVALAARHALPTVYFRREYADIGG